MLDQLLSGDAVGGLVEKLISDKAGDFVEDLVVKVGFSKEQAERFVPVAIKVLVPLLKAKLTGDEDPAPVDTAAVAEAAAVPEAQAKTGLDQMEPALADLLKEQLGDGALGSAADLAGDLLGGKGGLGGLFS